MVYTKTAEFTNLGYGKYQFEVQCSLDGVHWSPVASSPAIQILTPFLLRWYMWLLYVLLFISSIIAVTFYVLKHKEKKRTELLSRQKLENELQLRTLHSKVLPHFTKNVLTAIGHFAMDDNRKAGKYIAMFSKFTQLTLANSDKNYNTLEEELSYIQTYLELEQMRFGDKFTYRIEMDDEVDKNTVYVPAMALHTYCDNAIRHGLVNKKGDGELDVDVRKITGGTLISVSDNGIGRKRSAELGTQGNRMGLKLVQQQLDFYNQINEQKMTQTIVDLHDETESATGTQIELFVPKEYHFSNEQ
ncbi:MAG: histidine kinase [Paludibacteraceae bacterium]